MPRTRASLALALLVAGCSTATTATARPPRLPEPSVAAGPVSKAALQAALLLPSELPRAPILRTYAEPGLVIDWQQALSRVSDHQRASG